MEPGRSVEPPEERSWEYRAPPVLMPVPAAEVTELSGRRMVHHDASQGVWIYELRAVTEPHQRDGRRVVGVLDEAEWYRTLREPDYVAVPRSCALQDLWVEVRQEVGNVSPMEPDQADIVGQFRTKSIVSDLSRPPVRWLRFAQLETEVTGARAWMMTPQGPSSGWRVVGEPRRRTFETTLNFTRGLDSLDEPVVGTVVPVCTEADWYRWRQTGEVPQCKWPATQFVWLE